MSETKEWIRMAEKAVLDGDYLKSISLSLLVLMWDVSEGSDGMKFKRRGTTGVKDMVQKATTQMLDDCQEFKDMLKNWSPPCVSHFIQCDKCKGRADVLHADLSGDNLCGGCKDGL